jgi:hypothetical protein
MQEHAQKIASTASVAYELSPHSLGFDQANLQPDAIAAALKCFLIEDPWGEITRLASRLGLAALPLDETYRAAALRRHKAAHVAHTDIPQTDLAQFTKEALAIAIGFDALLSRAIAKMRAHDQKYLRGSVRVTAASIQIRSIAPDGGKWRESLEGRASAVKIEATSGALLAVARPRAVSANNLLTLYDENSRLSGWECY